MTSKSIVVAREFSRFPAGRYATDGPFSGQKFRDEVLAPALRSHDRVEVQLDGTLGYGSSFLEEAFGGLVRGKEFNEPTLKSKLIVHSLDASLLTEIWENIAAAEAAR